jgi:hypothetical protein
MATALIEASAKLPVCDLSRKEPGRAVSCSTHCCGGKSPFPFVPHMRWVFFNNLLDRLVPEQ